MPQTFELAKIGAESENNCELLIDSPSHIPRSFEESRVTSPKSVRRKRCAPFKRKMPKVKEAIKRKNETAKKVLVVNFQVFYMHIYLSSSCKLTNQYVISYRLLM